MDTRRIAELLKPFFAGAQLPPESLLSDISTYIDLLLRWNARLNLTAIRDPERIVRRHFGESLFAARELFPDGAAGAAAQHSTRFSLADLGSGAGFPGVPIKLWAPEVHLTLIESNHKKATFLRELVRTLTLTNIDIQNARAESLPENSFDLVTLRAVERFDTILPIAANLVAPKGRLALLIGTSQLDHAQAALHAFNFAPPVPIPLSDSRCLLTGCSSK